jgi:hypothetical protein
MQRSFCAVRAPDLDTRAPALSQRGTWPAALAHPGPTRQSCAHRFILEALFVKHVAFAAAFSLAALPVHADEVADTLRAALEAYEEGDIAYALEEVEYARQKMLEMKSDALVDFLPAAPEGWTREISTEMGAGLAMMGGGTGAQADYSADDGSGRISLTLIADSPMIGAMSGMLNNAAAMGLKVERIGRQKFAIQDNEVTGLVDNRILVQAEGQDIAQVFALLETIDYRELGRFGQ